MLGINKRTIISLIFGIFICRNSIADINYIKQDNSWITIQSTSQTKQMSSTNGHLIGHNNKIFILEGLSYYYIYDEQGRQIKSMNKSATGRIISVVGNGFIVEYGAWLHFYNNNGNKIQTQHK